MLAKDHTYDYFNIPLVNREVRAITVGVVVKEPGVLLDGEYDRLMFVLDHLFKLRHMPDAQRPDGTFAPHALMRASFEHFVRQSTHIYFAVDPNKNNETVAYMLADKNEVLDLFVVKQYRRDRIAVSMINMLIWKNEEPDEVIFVSNSAVDSMDGSGLFQKLGCVMRTRYYKGIPHRFSYVLVNKAIIKHNRIEEIKKQLDGLGVSYDIKEAGIELHGTFTKESNELIRELMRLVYGED